jgi:2'-5' RNA ligase
MNTQECMRVFFAVEFPESIKQHLHTVQQEVKKSSRSGNFTLFDNFHLTLRFIGETGPSGREVLTQAADAAACRAEPFQISLQGLGHFPRGSKHIIWVSIKACSQLVDLYSCLEEELAVRGVDRERRKYTPHITLGREVILENDFSNISASVTLTNLIVPVSRISLMQSTRIDNQLRYIPIYSKELKRTACIRDRIKEEF